MLTDLLNRYPQLADCKEDILLALDTIIKCYEVKGKLLLCGNGGSAADCDHIVGELMKDFLIKRPLDESQRARMKKKLPKIEDAVLDNLQCGLPAISLPSITGFNTAFCNDRNAELVYAQLVFGYGREGDLLICLSTSGNSKNAVAAAKVAKALGVKTLALTGAKESKLSEICDVCIKAPETETFKVQELHLPIYHYLCANLEDRLFHK